MGATERPAGKNVAPPGTDLDDGEGHLALRAGDFAHRCEGPLLDEGARGRRHRHHARRLQVGNDLRKHGLMERVDDRGPRFGATAGGASGELVVGGRQLEGGHGGRSRTVQGSRMARREELLLSNWSVVVRRGNPTFRKSFEDSWP